MNCDAAWKVASRLATVALVAVECRDVAEDFAQTHPAFAARRCDGGVAAQSPKRRAAELSDLVLDAVDAAPHDRIGDLEELVHGLVRAAAGAVALGEAEQ